MERIAYLDIDGVVANTGQAVIDLVRKEFKKPWVRVEDIKEYEIPKLPWLTEEEVKRLLIYFGDPEFYYHIQPMPEAAETTALWHKKGWQIIFVTARPPHLYEVTLYWLRKHGFVFDSLIMSSPFDKVNYCANHAECFLVEDRPDVLCHIAQERPKLKLFLYDQPWNQTIELTIATRIRSLKEIKIIDN
jgi:uncharacterized HAD superfamily protein